MRGAREQKKDDKRQRWIMAYERYYMNLYAIIFTENTEVNAKG